MYSIAEANSKRVSKNELFQNKILYFVIIHSWLVFKVEMGRGCRKVSSSCLPPVQTRHLRFSV